MKTMKEIYQTFDVIDDSCILTGDCYVGNYRRNFSFIDNEDRKFRILIKSGNNGWYISGDVFDSSSLKWNSLYSKPLGYVHGMLDVFDHENDDCWLKSITNNHIEDAVDNMVILFSSSKDKSTGSLSLDDISKSISDFISDMVKNGAKKKDIVKALKNNIKALDSVR